MVAPSGKRPFYFSMNINIIQPSTSTEHLSQIFWRLFRIAVSLSLLFLDNTVLLAVILLAYFRSTAHNRPASPEDGPFHPKTILITGIGTSHALDLARAWALAGYRVIGADVADLDIPVRSGGGMSTSLRMFYRIPKDHYTSRILDIVQREKVDIWIPCSPKATAIEDAMTRQVIEGRTSCKCIAFGSELAASFARPDSFQRFLTEKGLPVLERHEVQSRDSIHKILHGSPSKSYRIRRLTPMANEAVVILPKRTLSNTYSAVSEIQISRNLPWVLHQQNRSGEIFADLLLVRGHVHVINVRPAKAHSIYWGASPLDEALTVAVHQLMQELAMKGGARMTGHLSVRLLVDREFDSSSVRLTLYIADCVVGAPAVKNVLRNNEPFLIHGYLAVLSPEPIEPAAWNVAATLPPSPHMRPCLWNYEAVIEVLPRFLRPKIARVIFARLHKELMPFMFWKESRFACDDPLPWWWHVHVYQPLREIWLMMKQTREAGLTIRAF